MPAQTRWHFLFPPTNDGKLLREFCDMTCWEVPPPLAAGVDDAISADERTRAEDAVAADLCMVANEGPELAEASGYGFLGGVNFYEGLVESHIGKNNSCAEVGFVAENRVADIVEVWNLGFVEDEAVFKFRGISRDDAITEDDIFANVTTVTNLAVLTDPSWAFDHGPLLDHRALTDKDGAAHKWLTDEASVEAGFHAELQVGGDLWKCVPDVLDVLEKGAVLAVAEVKKFVDGKHGVSIDQKNQ